MEDDEDRLMRFKADTKEITCACFLDNTGKRFATGGNDGVSVWKVGFVASESRYTKQSEITSLSYNIKSNKFLSAGSRIGNIKIYDLNKEKVVRTLKGHRSSVNSLDFHPYGTFLVRRRTKRYAHIYTYTNKQQNTPSSHVHADQRLDRYHHQSFRYTTKKMHRDIQWSF